MKEALPSRDGHPGGKVLVVGGYGRVGAHISTALASELDSAVVVAGRDRSEARRAAQRIGRGVEGRALDLRGTRFEDTLTGVRLVIVCVDQEDTRFLRACIERGVHYVDVTASDVFFQRAEELSRFAVERGVSVVLSVGVAPGLSNLLAARACATVESAERVDILVELGMGDRHGVAAIGWTLGRLGRSFEIADRGVPRSVRSFGQRALMSFPGERPRWAYRFDISDQHALHRSLGVDAATWLRLSSSVATDALGLAVRSGLVSSLGKEHVRNRIARALSRVHVGSRRCGVSARALGIGGASATCWVKGREEARMTAAVATAIARQVLAAKLPRGVIHSHEGVDLEDVVHELELVIPGLEVSLPPRAPREGCA